MDHLKFEAFAAAFAPALNALLPGWVAREGSVYGPAGAVVRFSEEHDLGSEEHVDVEFILDANEPNSPRIWDCVSGLGNSLVDRARFAAHLWASACGVALLELKYSGRGQFADHYQADESEGLTGWHCICSALLGFGQGRSAEALVAWWTTHPVVLPKIAAALQNLPGGGPHGIKIFFGGQDVAEVRVDGEFHEEASKALQTLNWPRLEPPGFLRAFVLALHRV